LGLEWTLRWGLALGLGSAFDGLVWRSVGISCEAKGCDVIILVSQPVRVKDEEKKLSGSSGVLVGRYG
jgi:hypothetical protein